MPLPSSGLHPSCHTEILELADHLWLGILGLELDEDVSGGRRKEVCFADVLHQQSTRVLHPLPAGAPGDQVLYELKGWSRSE